MPNQRINTLNKLMLLVAISFLLGLLYLVNFEDKNIAEKAQTHIGLNVPYPFPETSAVTALNGTGDNFLVAYKELGLRNSAGRTHSLVIDIADSNHLMVATATGGIWSSENRGLTWSVIDDFAPSLTVQNLVQDVNQSSNYYYSSYETFAGTTNDIRPGIFKSTDNGKSFKIIKESSNSNWSRVQRVLVSPIYPNTIYAIGSSREFGVGPKLYRSKNGGDDFEIVYQSVNNQGFNEFHLLSNGHVMLIDGTEVFRSESGDSASFVSSSTGLDDAGTYSRLRLSHCASKPNVVYALAVGGTIKVGVFKSTDGGSNWTYTGVLNSGVQTSAIGVKPDDPDFVLGGSVGLNVTTDGGQTWNGYQAAGVDYWSVNYDPHNPDVVFVTYDGGVARFDLNPFKPNPWDALTKLDSLLKNTQIHAGDFFPTSNSVVVGMQDIGTRASMEDGSHRGISGNDGSYCYVHQQDSTIVYASYQNGRILKKENLHIPFPQPGYKSAYLIQGQMDSNGDRNIDEGALFINPFWVNYADGNQLYFPTKKRLWRSRDAGENWEPVSNTFSDRNYSMKIEGSFSTNPNVYWSVNDTLYVLPKAKTGTKDDVFKLKAPYWIKHIRLAPDNDSIVYIVVSTSQSEAIYKSSNLFSDSVHWTAISRNGFPESLSINCVEVNPKNQLQMVAGTNKGIYTTQNGGQSWTKELCFPNVRVKSSKIRLSDGKLFFYTYGRGAWSAEFPSSTSSIPKQDNSLKPRITIWPNPATDILHVGLSRLNTGADFEIYDISGKKIQIHSSIETNPASIAVSELKPGWYVLRYQNDGNVLGTAKFYKR